MAFNYLYNKQVTPDSLLTHIISFSGKTPLNLNYDLVTHDIVISYSVELTPVEEDVLNDAISSYTYIDKGVFRRTEIGSAIIIGVKTTHIEYDTPFDTEPKVILQLENNSSNPVIVQNSDVNGFEIKINNNWTGTITYIAIETLK